MKPRISRKIALSVLTYIVLGGALNSTHSLTSDYMNDFLHFWSPRPQQELGLLGPSIVT